MVVTKLLFELQVLKAKIMGVLTHTVVMVACVRKLIPTCSTVIEHFCETMVLASADIER